MFTVEAVSLPLAHGRGFCPTVTPTFKYRLIVSSVTSSVNAVAYLRHGFGEAVIRGQCTLADPP